ncbi:MAG: cold shock domain-containing protein [Pirellulales bacterium]
MPQGKVKRLISDKGFGFIEGDSGDDLFFHHSSLEGTTIEALREGQMVDYEVGRGPKGPRAENVRVTA